MNSNKYERFITISPVEDPLENLNCKKKSILSILKAGIGTGLLVMPYVF